MLPRSTAQKIILGSALFFLLAFCLYPFLVLFSKVVWQDGQFHWHIFSEVLQTPLTRKAFANTLVVSFAVSILSLILALPLAWVLTRTTLPGANRFRSWFCLPYAIPPYIGAIAWISLANPTNGLLNLGLTSPLFNIYSYFGLIWVQATFFYTLILLGLLSALDRMDSSLEEAARLSGASPLRVFVDITLPLIKPSLLSGVVLVVLASAASFGVPALIGNPAKIYLLTTQIYTYQKMGSMNGVLKAGALSIILLAVAAVFLFANTWVLRQKQFGTVSGKVTRPSLLELGRSRWPIVFLLVCLLLMVFVVPIFGIALTAFSKIQGQFSVNNLGFENFFRVLFEMSETTRALTNSLYLGAIAASLAASLGMLVAYLQWKTKLPGRQWLDVVASFPYSAPGTVVALALILTFSKSLFGIGPSLYNTLALLWLAYLIKYLSFAVKTLGNGLVQIDDVLAEASRVAGASWLTTMKNIWLPLLKPALVAAWFLVFMPAFSELTMTIMLTGPGVETVGTLLFQMQEYADVGGGGSAVLALLVVTMVLTINFTVKKLSKGQFGL